MHKGYTANEYGTTVSKHVCDTCGGEFTVCPAAFPETKGWDSCLQPQCASYDASRDVDKMLEEGSAVLVRGGGTGQT